MPLESLLRSMEAEAEEERGRILAEAHAEAERILASARLEVAAAAERRLDVESRRGRADRARAENDARLAGLRALARARERLAEDALSRAELSLAGLRDGPDYPAILRRLLEEAARELDTAQLVVEVDPRDADLVRALAAAAELEVSVAPTLRSSGGVVVADPSGAVVVRNTFEERLRKARAVLHAELVVAVEPSPQPAPGIDVDPSR